MAFAVCTLFENHYHIGLAALTNSLYKKGYRGEIFAGYRGKLPPWAASVKPSAYTEWKGSSIFSVAEGLNLVFLPLETDYHFANYKPAFMLRLMGNMVKDAEGLIYLDPDILVTCKWDFFEDWSRLGVSVVHETLWKDMPAAHPVRLGWEQLIRQTNRRVTADIRSYLNSGFCGVSQGNISFLHAWAEFIELAISGYGHKKTELKAKPRTNPFYCADRDAFNIAAMCCGCVVSDMGPEAMDFEGGGWTMSHATARPKPWMKNYMKSFLKGKPPTLADHNFWVNVSYPIAPFTSRGHIRFKIICLRLASFFGRFYRRY